MPNATLMLSGGLDSVVLAHWAKDNGYSIQALFFDYGQDALPKEMSAARHVATELGIPIEVFDISGLRRNFMGLTGPRYHMISSGGDVGQENPNNPKCEDTGLALGIAAEYTVLTKREILLIGAVNEDKRNGPELKEFFDTFSQSIRHLYAKTGEAFKVETPFLDKAKAEVIKLGESLNVDWSHCWSCEASGNLPCQRCGGCEDRTQAFKGVPGVRDTQVTSGRGSEI